MLKFEYILRILCLFCVRAQAKLIKMVDDVIVESYSKNMDLDSMKVSLSANAGTFGDYTTANDGLSTILLEDVQR